MPDQPDSLLLRLHQEMRDWCRGRVWLWRLPILFYFAYVGVRQVADSAYWSLFDNLNLPIHEAGHLLFRVAGEFLCAAGGTILQLLAPIGSMVMFFRQRDYFAIAVCFGWLSTNLYQIGTYMRDARTQAMDLVTVGNPQGPVSHDWNYLFGQLGLLRFDTAIGWLTCQAGLLSMLVCLAGGAWLLREMAKFPAAGSDRE